MADFHLCSTHKSYNQVDFIPLRSTNNKYCYESTFAYPRYILEGDRPNQTYISVTIVTV